MAWWRRSEFLRSREAVGPDLSCECGWLDAVPVRALERSRLETTKDGSVVAVSRVVGHVYRCSRCMTEYCAGPTGVYKPGSVAPRFPAAEDNGDAKPKRRDEPQSMRDADQPWESHRR